jgi:hypothetical protein
LQGGSHDISEGITLAVTWGKKNKTTKNLREIRGSHRGDYENHCPLECQSGKATLKMKPAGSSKMVTLYQTTWYQITEDNNLKKRKSQNS